MENLDHPASTYTTDIPTRIALLQKQVLFSESSTTSLKELAHYLQDVAYAAGDVIVTEGGNVDAIFLIVVGHVNVLQKQKGAVETIASLHPTEAIGINDIGFFSQTGLRTATVIATTPLHLLRLKLNDLQQFLQNHPEFNLEKTTKIFNYMHFIKQLEPFAHIDPAVAYRVAQNIQEITLPADEIIFQQDDIEHCCYLLYSGAVEIYFKKTSGEIKKIIELKTGNIFGELSLLTAAKRNASAKTTAPSKLLKLNREDFLYLMQQHGPSQPLLTMLMDRDRPHKNQQVSVHERKAADDENIIILKNAATGSYMQIPPQALLVWELLDGEHTLQDIAFEFYKKYKAIAIDEIGDLILRLIKGGFVETHNVKLYNTPAKLPWWLTVLVFIRKIMEFEIPFNNVDNFLTRAYNKFGFIFFTKPAKIIYPIIASLGFVAFISFFGRAEAVLTATEHAWLLLVYLIPASILIIVPHELAHAFTTKAYGRQVHRMGIGWFWTGPVAFTDTSDMWLSERKPRMAVNIAGIYCNIIIAGLAAIFAVLINAPQLATFLWLFSFLSYALALYNLDPLIELDGYYLLMDFFDKPNLRVKAIRWLAEDSKNSFKNSALRRQYRPEIVYWLSCIIFFILLSMMTYLIATYVIGSLVPAEIFGFNMEHLRWILVLLVLFFSVGSVYSSLKHGLIKLGK